MKPVTLRGVRQASIDRYIRPAGTTYGTGDGLTYANAVAGLSAIPWSAVNGTQSTIWICGTHYERLTPLQAISGISTTARLKIRCDYGADPGIIDGAVSFNGTNTVNPAQTYNGTPSAWANLSGEIYYKTTTRCPYGFWEDGTELTPILLQWSNRKSNEYVAATLARGQFGWFLTGTVNADGSGGAVSNRLYYRASNGAAPSTHDIYCPGRNYDGLASALFSDCRYLTLNLTLRRWRTNTTGVDIAALHLRECVDIVLDGDISDNAQAARIDACTTLTINPTFAARRNIYSGLILENDGNTSSAYTIGGTYYRNGRPKLYTGALYYHTGDGDNIGIGGTGGTFNSITVSGALLEESGPDNSLTMNITTTNGSKAVTVASTDGLRATTFDFITAAGVTAGTTVESITDATTFQLSANATASGTVSAVIAAVQGANLYVGTSYSCQAAVSLINSTMKNSIGWGAYFDPTDWTGGTRSGNTYIGCTTNQPDT